jgi:hypothetical protein
MFPFAEQLKALGHEVKEEGDRVSFPFKIETGKLTGTEITLGFVVAPDFLLNPPSGPHIRPRLLPMNNTPAAHPVGGVSDSPFGAEWQYWSRPIKHWPETPRNAAAYMAHIRRLFDTL